MAQNATPEHCELSQKYADFCTEFDFKTKLEYSEDQKQCVERSLEVCIDSLESALNAIHGGADELEVCSSLAEGGLTPSAGLLKEILQVLENISHNRVAHKSCTEECVCLSIQNIPKVNVMLRCRAGSDFCYSEMEMDTMISDLEIFKTMNVDRFVFGALDLNQNIDVESCKRVVEAAASIPVTFHRAFDVCRDPVESLESVISLGFDRLLTSGQAPSVVEPEGIAMLEQLVNVFKDRIQIMPGAGITSLNVELLKSIPCTIFHGSCKVVKSLLGGLAIGSGDSQTFYYVTDRDEVRRMKQVLCEI